MLASVNMANSKGDYSLEYNLMICNGAAKQQEVTLSAEISHSHEEDKKRFNYSYVSTKVEAVMLRLRCKYRRMLR